MIKIFSADQAAIVLNVSRDKVENWLEKGELRGYRVPGTKERKIPKPSLIQFMIDRGYSRKDFPK